MYETNKTEARTTRDGRPVESGSPLASADAFEAFQPALDAAGRFGDPFDNAAQNHVRSRDEETRPKNPIGDTIADVFGAPEPPRDPFAEPTPIPNPFGEPQEVNEVDSVPVRATMAMRLDALRKDREAAREV
jgi:hypothetical protein